MCQLIEHPNLMTGYGCCKCHTYNGLHRHQCKYCGRPPCDLEKEDKGTVLIEGDTDETV